MGTDHGAVHHTSKVQENTFLVEVNSVFHHEFDRNHHSFSEVVCESLPSCFTHCVAHLHICWGRRQLSNTEHGVVWKLVKHLGSGTAGAVAGAHIRSAVLHWGLKTRCGIISVCSAVTSDW